MQIKLLQLTIENFKGIKKQQIEVNGNIKVVAENGVGKTTLFDSFLWLFFGKDSTGRSDFGIRPLDKDNNPIKGLVTVVEAELSINGTSHVLRKELHENIVKGQLRGYPSVCSIDDVPKKVGEFNDYIKELIPEETFKLLTDLDYFNSKLEWKKRRNILLEFANYEAPTGFDKLHELLNGRSIDDFKKVLKTKKDGYEKERNEINPRIDELQKSLDEYASNDDSQDVKALEAQRTSITQEISQLRVQRSNLMGAETERQSKLESIQSLKNQRSEREIALKNDNSGIQVLFDEKQELDIQLSEKKQEINNLNNQIEAKQQEIKSIQVKLDGATKLCDELANQWEELNKKPLDGTCYACGQKLPADKLAEQEAGKKDKLADINEQGVEQTTFVDKYTREIEELNKSIQDLQKSLEQKQSEFDKFSEQAEKRKVEIDEDLKNRPAPDFTKDEVWKSFTNMIEKAESELGKHIGDQLAEIETMRISKENALSRIEKLLNNQDNIKKTNKRIEELKARKTELAQKIAELEGQLSLIDDYNVAESKAIEQAVNGMFKHVEFKLFDYYLNGGVKECCESTYNGVPYRDLSTGQKIFVGLDIVNVLSKHYGISAPLFIDHAESVTIPLETELQTIKLFAKEGVSELTITTEDAKELVNV